jgi:hypothetical protein
MKTMLTALCAIAALAAAPTANAATVIDFNEFTHDTGDLKLSEHFESQGYAFDLSIESAQAWIVYGKNDGRNADPGHATLMSNLLNTTTRMSRVNNGLFDLTSIDFSDLFNTGQSPWVRLAYTDALGATTSEMRRLDTTKGLETFAINQSSLRAFEYTFVANYTPGSPGWGQADNIVANAVAAPEPTTWALLIMGFGAAGSALRRKRGLTSA